MIGGTACRKDWPCRRTPPCWCAVQRHEHRQYVGEWCWRKAGHERRRGCKAAVERDGLGCPTRCKLTACQKHQHDTSSSTTAAAAAGAAAFGSRSRAPQHTGGPSAAAIHRCQQRLPVGRHNRRQQRSTRLGHVAAEVLEDDCVAPRAEQEDLGQHGDLCCCCCCLGRCY